MCVVCCVAKLDTDGLKKAGVSADDMSLHLALLFEYVFAHMNHDQYFNDGQGHRHTDIISRAIRAGQEREVCRAVRDVIVCCVCVCLCRGGGGDADYHGLQRHLPDQGSILRQPVNRQGHH